MNKINRLFLAYILTIFVIGNSLSAQALTSQSTSNISDTSKYSSVLNNQFYSEQTDKSQNATDAVSTNEDINYNTIYSIDNQGNIIQKDPNLIIKNNGNIKIESIKIATIPEEESPLLKNNESEQSTASSDTDNNNNEMSEEEAQQYGQALLESATITKVPIQSIKDSTSSLTKSSMLGLPDIYLHDYTISAPYEKYPFPTHKDTQIYFIIENAGTATATLPYLDMYVNGIKITASGSFLLPELEAGYCYEFEMPFRWSEGKNTVKFAVNESRVMGETDYNNNTVSITYQWKDYADFYMDSFDIETGERSFHALETKEFTSEIKNDGKAGADNINISVKDKNGNENFVYSTSLQPNYNLAIVVDLTIGMKTTNAYFDLIVDYDDDYNSKNNTKRSSTYQIEYALEPNGLKWKYSQIADLTVGICPSAQEFLLEQGLKDSEIVACFQEWNHISDKNHLVNITAMLSSSESPNTDIYITANSLTQLNESARTHLSNGGDYFTSGEVHTILNTNAYSWSTYTSTQKKATLIHEMGHALGLDHSYCLDKSIMTEYADNPCHSTSITSHDEYNFKYLYGNL